MCSQPIFSWLGFAAKVDIGFTCGGKRLEISTPEAYRQALDRLSELRDNGVSADTSSEFAELEGAIAAYEVRNDGPGQNKGRPKADP